MLSDARTAGRARRAAGATGAGPAAMAVPRQRELQHASRATANTIAFMLASWVWVGRVIRRNIRRRQGVEIIEAEDHAPAGAWGGGARAAYNIDRLGDQRDGDACREGRGATSR